MSAELTLWYVDNFTSLTNTYQETVGTKQTFASCSIMWIRQKMNSFFKKGWPFFIIIGLFGMLLASPILLRKNSSPSTKPVSNTRSISAEKDYWFNRIQTIGGEKSYQEFKHTYLSLYPKDIHYITHLFGEGLYMMEGNKSMVICDSFFAYGCYHGFIISALEDKGLSIIPTLNTICKKYAGTLETGCRHGIGHGLIEYLGHTQLEKALSVCSSIQRITPLGCTQGVFMEYNQPAMAAKTNIFLNTRKLENEKALFEPCRSLPDKYQTSCYYEQSQWWILVLHNDYQKVGSLCNTLIPSKVRRSCFMGVGTIVAQTTKYDVAKTTRACDSMPEMADVIDCRATAAWVFRVNPHYTKQAVLLCKGLSEQEKNICLANAISPDKIIY